MTQDQITVVRSAASALRRAAANLRNDREDIHNVRWAGEKIAEAGLDRACSEGVSLIKAAIKAFGQGNDRSTASYADAAADSLTALTAAE